MTANARHGGAGRFTIPAASVLFVAAWAAAGTQADARPEAVERAEISFTSGDVRLAGSLFAPGGRAPSKGVVLLPGSGPATRDVLAPVATAFAERGVHVLAFDKRGSGESGGDWSRSSLDDLARDACAAMRILARDTDLAADRIGLWGHSQGVWVAARAVALCARPAFLIAVSGGGVSPRTVERYAYEQKLIAAGISGPERAAAMGLVERYFEYLVGDISLAALRADLNVSRSAKVLRFPIPSEADRAHWRWVAQYDSGAAVGSLQIPTFVIIGGRDDTIPRSETIDAWTDGLARSAPMDDRIMIVPDADHHLRAGGGASHHAGVAVDPAIWDQLTAWIATAK